MEKKILLSLALVVIGSISAMGRQTRRPVGMTHVRGEQGRAMSVAETPEQVNAGTEENTKAYGVRTAGVAAVGTGMRRGVRHPVAATHGRYQHRGAVGTSRRY